MFRVVKLFTDLQDDNYKYEVGDEYPRLGLKPSLARIKELSGSDNRQGTPLIEEVEYLILKTTDGEEIVVDAGIIEGHRLLHLYQILDEICD
jgi:hypothetical protein